MYLSIILTRLDKISLFVGGEKSNYLPMPKAEANFRHRQVIDLRAIDKSRYFAQPRLIIVLPFS